MPRFPRSTLLAVALVAGACSGGGGGSSGAAFDDQQVIVDFADQVVIPTYQLLAARADTLAAAVDALVDLPGDGALATARATWVAARQPWEQGEGFLFGPVDSFGYDPALDSWPVNATDLEAVLDSGQPFTPEFVANLASTQKGFHTIEYLIFGEGGTRTAASLTTRELDYLAAITAEFAATAHALSDAWTSGYRDVLAGAGSNSTYATLAQAAEEILGGMVGICDELANGKIADPYDAHDPTLVESQFSYNSIQDFQDNLRSVENAYTGGSALAGTAGLGLSDWVAERDPALDVQVKAEISAAIAALGAIPPPFRDAITTPSAYDEIEAAQAAIRALLQTLQDEVRSLVLE
jgi:putative iron-regulated protein